MEIEQGRINVPIGGISRAGSESKTNDGLCNEIINLEAKDMTLVPYEHKRLESNEYKIYGYKTKKIFLHKTSVQTNLVYVDSENELYFFNYEVFDLYKKESFLEDDKGCILAEKDGELFYVKATKIENLEGVNYEEVDMFYNMFSFRNGVWYMFKEGKYSTDYCKENMKIDLAFDIKTQGIAIANRYFNSTRYMMGNFDDGQWKYNNYYKQKVASELAKNVNGLYNMIDSYIDSYSGKYRINGISYLRYGVRSSDGYAYISDPILIASPDAKKIFKKTKSIYVSPLNNTKDISAGIPAMPILGGNKGYETDVADDEIVDKVDTPFNSTGNTLTNVGFWKFTKAETIKWFGAATSEAEENFNYGLGDGSISIDDLKLIRDAIKTKGYAPNGYDKEDESNTSCKLFDKVTKLDTSDNQKFWTDKGEEKQYTDYERPLRYHELSWALTGTASDNVSNKIGSRNAAMYACKEYGHLFAKCINMPDGFKRLLEQGLIIQVDVFITNPVNPVLPVIEEDDETYNDITINEFTKNYVDAAQCNSGRIRKSKSEIEAEMANLTYFKLFSLKKNDLLELGKDWQDINDKITQSPKGLVASEEAQQLTVSGNLQNETYKIGYVYNTQLHTAIGERTLGNSTNNLNIHQRMENYSIDDTNGKQWTLKVFYTLYSDLSIKRLVLDYGCGNGVFANPISIPHTDVKKVTVLLYDREDKKHYLIGMYDGADLKMDSNLTYVHFCPSDLSEYEDGIEVIYPNVEIGERGQEVDAEEWGLNLFSQNVKLSSRKNTMQVMLPEDPLVADRQYTVGTGDIISICANTVALSAGQYGEYPIFVFTTDGIYTLQLDSQKLEYSNITPLSREICNNPKSICQVDNGVFFSSEKGLMVISGTQALCVSDVVKGKPKPTGNKVYSNATDNAKLVELNGNVSQIDFVEYLKECQIVYLYKKNKLLITNEKYDYSYFYDLGEKTFTKLSYKYHYSISNYPNDLLVANQGDKSYIYEFPIESVDENIETMIETRSIKLGTEDIKSSYRVVLKGLFETDGTEENHLGIYVFGSLDCEKWAYIGGNEVSCKHKTIRNIGCKVERMGAKYMRVLFVGKLKKGSKVDTLEISSTKKYSNKIR